MLMSAQENLMAVIREIVFDCAHPAALARFWAAALEVRSRRRAFGLPHDDVDHLAVL